MLQIPPRAPHNLRRFFLLFVWLFFCINLPGCALFRPADLPPLIAQNQAKEVHLKVPFFAQSEHQCGPAATAMLLKFSGIDVTPERLTESVYSQNKEGSLQPSIVAAIRRNQRIAYEIDDWSGLLAELNAGRPVLVLENLGVDFWPFWHYSLVIGYDSERDEVILHSGTHADERVNARRFAFRWLRGQLWGLVALKPDEWPANAEENKYLQAVLGFARVNPDAALTSFELATQHWPSNAKAWVGLGNTALEQKSFLKAVMALEKASTLAPQSSGIWNNLTLAYFYAGQQKEAEQAIRMAKKLAPNDSAILETEKQILLKH